MDKSAHKSEDVEGSLDDATLVAHCLTDQESAWQALADRLRRLASGWLALHPAGSPADADDLLQEVLTTLLADDRRLLRAFDPRRARLTTYLGVILRRRAAARQRKLARESPLDQPVPDPSWMDMAVDDVWQFVQRILPPLDVLILRYTALGYPAADIADLLSRSQGRPFTADAVRQRRSRARKRLRTARPSSGI